MKIMSNKLDQSSEMISVIRDTYDENGKIKETGMFRVFKLSLKHCIPEFTVFFVIVYLFLLSISAVSSFSIVQNNNSMAIVSSIISYISDIYLGLFSASLIGFTLMLSLDKNTIQALSKSHIKQNNAMLEYYFSILGILFYLLTVIFINFFLKILVDSNINIFSFQPSNIIYLADHFKINTKLFFSFRKDLCNFLFLSVYFMVLFHGLLDIFSLIYNMFSLHILDSYISKKK